MMMKKQGEAAACPERIWNGLVGPDDDDKFNGLDLANLIRKKYGRSYDVTLIKKVQCSARPSWPLN